MTTLASERPLAKTKLATLAKRFLGIKPRDYAAAAKGLKRFESFCELVTTESGGPFRLEWWQRLVLIAYFAGVTEILIVVPKGNGKTTLLAALAVFHLLTTDYPEVYIGASTKAQADVMYGEARRISQLHAAWRKRLIPRQSTRFIYVGKGGARGFLRVLASDRLKDESGGEDGRGVLEGIKPTLGLIDELHAHINDAIYAAIHGALHKRNGQIITISTAGSDELGILKRMRDAALKLRQKVVAGKFTVARSAAFVMFLWELLETDDREDMAVVKQANPSSFVTKSKLRQLRASPSMTAARWAKRHCNLWGHAEGGWLESEHVDQVEVPDLQLPTDEPIILGYDHARTYDQAALMAVRPTDMDGGHRAIEDYDPEQDEAGFRGDLVPVEILKPKEQDGGRVPYWRAKRAILDACEKYTVAAVGFDPNAGFAHSAEELADLGINMVPVSMRGNVWAPLTSEMYAGFKGARIRIPVNPDFRSAILAGETKGSEWGDRLHGRPKSGQKVDPLIAGGIAWFTAFFTDALTTESPWDRRSAAGEEDLL